MDAFKVDYKLSKDMKQFKINDMGGKKNYIIWIV